MKIPWGLYIFIFIIFFHCNFVQAQTFQTTLKINNQTPSIPANKMILGGNVIYTYAATLARDASAFKVWGGGSARWHMYDDTRWGQRWDTHNIEAEGDTKNYNLENIESDQGAWIKELQGTGTIAIDYWQSAGKLWNRHSLSLSATASTDRASILMPKLQSSTGNLGIQFAIKIDSMNFTGESLLLHVDDWRFRIFLNSEGKLVLKLPGGADVEWQSEETINNGQWNLITLNIFSEGVEIYINEKMYALPDTVIPLDNWPNWHLGSIPNSGTIFNDRLDFHLDEIRVHSQPVTPKILTPWNNNTNGSNFDRYYSFDSNWATFEDFLNFCEQTKLTPIIQIPLTAEISYGTPTLPGSQYDWDTLQYWADLVEYINGTADEYFETKTFDYSHQTPSDNWANLRAQRGRIKPYNVQYFEIGNEPYYQGWNQNNNWAGYAQKWLEQAHFLKEVDDSLILGLPGRKGWGSQNIWDVAIPIINSVDPNLIGFLSVHHYTKIYNVDQKSYGESEQMHWYLGAPSSWRTLLRPDEEAGRPVYREIALAQDMIQKYFPEQIQKPFVALTEFNFEWKQYSYFDNSQNKYIYTGDTFADAFQRVSALGEMARLGVLMGQTFALDTDQKFVYGIIGDNDLATIGRNLSPSYLVYRYFSQVFQNDAQYLSTSYQTDYLTWDMGQGIFIKHQDPKANLNSINKWGETYTTPLLSIWPFKSANSYYIVVANRSSDQMTNLNLDFPDLNNITRIYGYKIYHAANDPFAKQVVSKIFINKLAPSDKNLVAPGWQHQATIAPLSINFIRIDLPITR